MATYDLLQLQINMMSFLIPTHIQWKKRHVVFRVSAAGRLEFLICKETTSVPGPVTEVKSIPIEEFGGLITNTKLDGEKYTFAVVSTEVTDCFATDTPDEHTAWTSTIREYLGKGKLPICWA